MHQPCPQPGITTVSLLIPVKIEREFDAEHLANEVSSVTKVAEDNVVIIREERIAICAEFKRVAL